MTEPFSPKDFVAPVVLAEPRRFERPGVEWAWSAVLSDGERPLWQGLRQKPSFLDLMAQIWRMTARITDPWSQGGTFEKLLFVLVRSVAFAVLAPASLLLGARPTSRAKDQSQTQYLLTDRACYLADTVGQGLGNVVSFPISPGLRLGLGGRSVVFGVIKRPDSEDIPQGFLDIPDADAVYAMIRDIQKGQP